MTAMLQPDDGPVSQHVVEKVAEVTETDPADLEPLFNTVDPDCLNTLFSDVQSASSRNEGHVAFPVADCQVVIWADGRVEVAQNDDDPAVASNTAARTDSPGAPESPD